MATMKQELMTHQAKIERLEKRVKALEAVSEDTCCCCLSPHAQLMEEINDYLGYTEGDHCVPKYVWLLRKVREHLDQ